MEVSCEVTDQGLILHQVKCGPSKISITIIIANAHCTCRNLNCELIMLSSKKLGNSLGIGLS